MATNSGDRTLNTQISTKLAALGVALIMNSALIGGVAFLFNGQLHPAISQTSATSASAAHVSYARA
jgi:hypothetical protein